MARKLPPSPASSSPSLSASLDTESSSSATSTDEEHPQQQLRKATPPDGRKSIPRQSPPAAPSDDSGSDGEDEEEDEGSEESSPSSEEAVKPDRLATKEKPTPAAGSSLAISKSDDDSDEHPILRAPSGSGSSVGASLKGEKTSSEKLKPSASISDDDSADRSLSRPPSGSIASAKPSNTKHVNKAEKGKRAPPEDQQYESEDDDDHKFPLLSSIGDCSDKAISEPVDGTHVGKIVKPEKPKQSMATKRGSMKRKQQKAGDAKQGNALTNVSSAKRAKKARNSSAPSKNMSASIGPKRLPRGDAAGKAGDLYPRLYEAVRLLMEEHGNNLLNGSANRALGLLTHSQAKALEEQWNNHFVEGFRYLMERAKLKEYLLKSLLDVLEKE